MANFQTIDDVVKHLQAFKWRGKDRKTFVSKRTVYEHIKCGFLNRKKDGTFIQKDVDRYAADFLENSVSQIAKNSISDALDRERLRKLQIENDKKTGELVSLSEEVLEVERRHATVIAGGEESDLTVLLSFHIGRVEPAK